jgi:hypothetical protein
VLFSLYIDGPGQLLAESLFVQVARTRCFVGGSEMLQRLAFLMITTSCLLTARADTITQINSSASETTNNSGFATQDISPVPAWASALGGSSWVSFANAGEVPNGMAVTFSDTFQLSGPVTAATLMVLADDTTSTARPSLRQTCLDRIPLVPACP